MKRKIMPFIKIFFIGAITIFITLVVIGITLALHWPWWAILFLLLFIGGLVLGGFFIRNLLNERMGKLFEESIVAQDNAQIQTLSGNDRDERKLLQARWRDAIDVLRKSHLKKNGNPLYVLPWYLVIGESGSGKTTSLNSARLATPFVDLGKTGGISGTRNCEWWFLEQAIVIDTAGRYCIPVNGEPDRFSILRILPCTAPQTTISPLRRVPS